MRKRSTNRVEHAEKFSVVAVTPRAVTFPAQIRNCFQNPWTSVDLARNAEALVNGATDGSLMCPEKQPSQLRAQLNVSSWMLDQISEQFAREGCKQYGFDDRTRARTIIDELMGWTTMTALLQSQDPARPGVTPPLIPPESVMLRLRELGHIGTRLAAVWVELFGPQHAKPVDAVAKAPDAASTDRGERKRRRRTRRDAPPGWVYLIDAASEYDIAKSTLHVWAKQLPEGDSQLDEDANQLYLRRSALEKLLARKGR